MRGFLPIIIIRKTVVQYTYLAKYYEKDFNKTDTHTALRQIILPYPAHQKSQIPVDCTVQLLYVMTELGYH